MSTERSRSAMKLIKEYAADNHSHGDGENGTSQGK